MENGLYIVSVPSGYYPYVLIGWCEIIGLELRAHNARVIRRFGPNQSLAQLAQRGPHAQTELLTASPIEYLWRASARAIPANAAKWEKECPKPKGWVDPAEMIEA